MAPQYRATAAMIMETTSSGFGIITVSLIGFMFADWIQFLLALSTLMVGNFAVIATMPRSFRWYFSKK